MTLQTLALPVVWPGFAQPAGNTAFGPATSGVTTASGAYIAWIFRAHQAMTVTDLGCRINTATGSPVGVLSLNALGATGLADGAILGAGNAGFVTFNPLTAAAINVGALGASVSLAAGDKFAVKLACTGGTSFVIQATTAVRDLINAPYLDNNGAKAALTSSTPNTPALLIGSSSSAFYPVFGNYPGANSASVNEAFDNTSSAARGAMFRLPFKARVCGMQVYHNAEDGDVIVSINAGDATGAVLSSSDTAEDGDHNAETATGFTTYMFDNPVTCDAGTDYRAVVAGNASGNNTSVMYAVLGSANYRSGWPGGSTFQYTSRTSTTWTEASTTRVPIINLLLDQLDDGLSAGGGAGPLIRGRLI